jgi:hypothetical protein
VWTNKGWQQGAGRALCSREGRLRCGDGFFGVLAGCQHHLPAERKRNVAVAAPVAAPPAATQPAAPSPAPKPVATTTKAVAVTTNIAAAAEGSSAAQPTTPYSPPAAEAPATASFATAT